jgi:hypothetical protein
LPISPAIGPVFAGDQFTVKVTLAELLNVPEVPVIVSLLEPVGVPPVGVWWLPHPNTRSATVNKPTAPNWGESRCVRIQQSKQSSADTVRSVINPSGGKL